MALEAAVAASIFTPVGILANEHAVGFAALTPSLSPVISNGLLPLVIVMFGFFGFYLLLKRKYSANKNEAIQTIFVFFLTAFIILTITGIWFRGPAMRLTWPWVAVG